MWHRTDTLWPKGRALFHQQFTATSQEAKQIKKTTKDKKNKLREQNYDELSSKKKHADKV